MKEKFKHLGRSLSKKEQKNILGGLDGDGGGGACSFTFIPGGTCGVRHNGHTVAYGMDQGQAIDIANSCTSTSGSNWYWCCDHC